MFGTILKLVFLAIIISLVLTLISEPIFYETNLQSKQQQIKVSNLTHVLTKQWKLFQNCWTKSAEHFIFDPIRINPSTTLFKILNKLRYKKWEGFVFLHKDFILCTGLFDLSYTFRLIFYYSDLHSHDKQIQNYNKLELLNKKFILILY